ncbi:MAG: hypothetical protein IOD12_11785 [Silvanigrellales bacterium]|nr:hypothetical protein [Silvanigrellales bacterium]
MVACLNDQNDQNNASGAETAAFSSSELSKLDYSVVKFVIDDKPDANCASEVGKHKSHLAQATGATVLTRIEELPKELTCIWRADTLTCESEATGTLLKMGRIVPACFNIVPLPNTRELKWDFGVERPPSQSEGQSDPVGECAPRACVNKQTSALLDGEVSCEDLKKCMAHEPCSRPLKHLLREGEQVPSQLPPSLRITFHPEATNDGEIAGDPVAYPDLRVWWECLVPKKRQIP